MTGYTTERIGRAAAGRVLALIGLLGASIVALEMAPAFACNGSIGGSLTFWPPRAPAETLVRVEGNQLPPKARIELLWGPPEVVLLHGTASEEGTFASEFRVPDTATIKEGRDVGYYQLRARQTLSNGDWLQTPAYTFDVLRPASQPTVPPTTAPSPTPTPTTTPTLTTTPSVPIDSGSGAVGLLDGAGGGETGTVAAPGHRAVPAPSGSSGPGAPSAPPGPHGAPSPAANSTGAGDTSDPNRDLLDTAGLVSDGPLWAGLDIARGPSLLDPAPQAPRRGLPSGAFLFAGGVATIGLAGLGGFAGRRRLAPAARSF